MEVKPETELPDRERNFFDTHWSRATVETITAPLRIPGVQSLEGKRVLICSCGSGVDPVMAARAGAIVSAFDISPVGVENARRVAEHNGVEVDARVMDFHALEYADESFDVIYGLAILHHVDLSRAGPHIWRCLAPGGTAYFRENSARNPLLRLSRRLIFGRRGAARRAAFGFHRQGTPDEYPLTEADVRTLRLACDGHLEQLYPQFHFFGLLAVHGWRNARFERAMRAVDGFLWRALPPVRPYGLLQDIRITKPASSGAVTA